MRFLAYPVLIIFTISAIHCGRDLIEEGKKAYSEGDYTQAIRLLTEAQKDDSTNRSYNDIIFLSYLYRGEELYHKTLNVDAFEGNFQKAQEYLPANPTAEFKAKYSKMLLSLAMAYYKNNPKTDLEKEENFESAFSRVKQAIKLDSTNSSADSMLAQLKIDHFQGLVDKGENLYNKAGRTGNADLYYTAEYYLNEALEFEPENQKILNLLKKIVQKTLPVLNYREDVSLAVAGLSRERKAISMTLSVKNYTDKPVFINLANFKLVDRDGNQYDVSEDEMQKIELFGETCIKNSILNQANPSIEGVIAFDAPKDAKLAYINYQVNKSKFTRKYFP